MLKRKKISVVVPAYNEEKLIRQVIETMPVFVDKIIIVDDCSKDKTRMIVSQLAKKNRKIVLIKHKANKGVGAAIVSGYKKAIELKMDVAAVMAGDAQMEPRELNKIVMPIVGGMADYTKGNRLLHGDAWRKIPKVRYFGNSILSLLTKVASGYWHVADSQTGYTAISRTILERIWLDNLYKRYGFPNDLLVHLNIERARVKEIPIKPIYQIGEKSGIKLWKVIPTISWLLLRRFFWRMKRKYVIENFHPLVFFYLFAIVLTLANIVLIIRLIYFWVAINWIPQINALAIILCTIMSSQFLFFAMWFDMDDNKNLKVE